MAVVSDAPLAVDDRAAVIELDRKRSERKEWARERQAERRPCDVDGSVQRVPSAFSQTAGTPKRR